MKDAIVSKHNDLRSKVANGLEVLGVDGTQPKAANMRELVWNDELAEVAQRYPTMITLHSLFLFIDRFTDFECLVYHLNDIFVDGLINVLVHMTQIEELRHFRVLDKTGLQCMVEIMMTLMQKQLKW